MVAMLRDGWIEASETSRSTRGRGTGGGGSPRGIDCSRNDEAVMGVEMLIDGGGG